MAEHRRDWIGKPTERWLSLSETLSWIAWNEIVRVEDLLSYASSRSVKPDQIASDLQESWRKLRDELSVATITARAQGARGWVRGEYAVDVDRVRNAPRLFWDPARAVLEVRAPEPPPVEPDPYFDLDDEQPST